MNPLWRLLRYARRYLPSLSLSVVLMAVAGAMHGMLPVLIGPIFDRVLNPKSPEARIPIPIPDWLGFQLYLDQLIPLPISNVWTLVAVTILFVFLVRGIADYAGNYLINHVGLSAVTDLRQQTFEKLINEEHEFFHQHSTGKLMSNIMSDIEKIQLAVSQMLADWFRQVFSAVFFLYVLFHSDWKLASVSLTLLPFVSLPTARLGKRIRRTTRTAQDHAAEMSQILQETFSGHSVVKAFLSEKMEAAKFRAAALRLKKSNLRYIAFQALPSPIIEFLGALTIVGLLTYARTQIKAGEMTSGQFTGFVIALLLLYEPVKRLTGIHNIFQQAVGASQRVFDYIDRPQRIADNPALPVLAPFSREILFDHIHFRYPGATNSFAIEDLTLEVRSGEVVAIVGMSGSGKSTIASLLPRFYDVDSGSIRIDGVDIRKVRLSSLRKQIAIVSQETFLFNDTVLNNIRYGRPDATPEQIRAAAVNALADDFIAEMPKGYQTVIGERGAKLSGGQRQRIAIARALLSNAPILILDEATSALDTESEALVQRALSNLMQNKTTIVIAHRLSTIRKADKIVVMDAGRITEIGSHDELVAQGGIYQHLHELQYLDLEH